LREAGTAPIESLAPLQHRQGSRFFLLGPSARGPRVQVLMSQLAAWLSPTRAAEIGCGRLHWPQPELRTLAGFKDGAVGFAKLAKHGSLPECPAPIRFAGSGAVLTQFGLAAVPFPQQLMRRGTRRSGLEWVSCTTNAWILA